MHRYRKIHIFHLATLLLFLISCYVDWSAFGKDTQGTEMIVVEADEEPYTVEGFVKEDGSKMEGDNGGEFGDVEVFQPTHEWKEILPGQAIPAGLHVRMDLSTGVKEAKFLEEDEMVGVQPGFSSDSNSLTGIRTEELQQQHDNEDGRMKYWKEGDRQGVIHTKNEYFTHAEMKEALKLFKANQDDVKEKENIEAIKNKYRSIEELKKEFKKLEMNMETDVEIMIKLLEHYLKDGATVEDRRAVLHDLEYYVHQIDNAKDLATLGGLDLVIAALNDSSEIIRQEAAFVLGSALQSNPHVQVLAIEGGALQKLFHLLGPVQSAIVRKKALYAMSALLRTFPYAQQKFLQLGGLNALSGLFGESDIKVVPLKVKAVTLVHDLLVEQRNILNSEAVGDVGRKRREQYEKVNLLPVMLEQGWCKLVPSLLDVPNNDVREKVLLAMRTLVDSCKEFYQEADVTTKLSLLKDEYEKLSEEEMQSGEMDDYFQGLSEIITTILQSVS